jgi:hypothetical protein
MSGQWLKHSKRQVKNTHKPSVGVSDTRAIDVGAQIPYEFACAEAMFPRTHKDLRGIRYPP